MKNIFFIVILSSQIMFSQTARIDTNSILIGEQTQFLITSPIAKTTQWPIYKDTIIKGVEIIQKSKIDTFKEIISQEFTITAWDSGSYYIPAIKFSENSQSNALLLNVNNIQLEDNTLKDIKQPLSAPFGWNDIWPWLIIILIIILVLLIIKKYILNKEKGSIKAKPEIKIPADITALNELKKLEKKSLWQEGKIKQYHAGISEIIRRYTEERFNFIALELTTDEIIQEIKNKIRKENVDHLQTILQRADLAKFAKSIPTKEENNESMELAKDFVINTKENPKDD